MGADRHRQWPNRYSHQPRRSHHGLRRGRWEAEQSSAEYPKGGGSVGFRQATVSRRAGRSRRLAAPDGVLARQPRLLVLLVGSAAAVVAETGADPDEAAAGEVAAVVALVPGEGRLAVAEAVRARTGKALVISARPADTTTPGGATPAERCGGADGDDVVCFHPERMPRDMLCRWVRIPRSCTLRSSASV